MKTIYFILTAALFFAFSCKQRDTLSIRGEIKNFPDSPIYLYTENNNLVEFDTIYLSEEGKFNIEKELTEPSIVTIVSSDKEALLHLFLYPTENVEIVIDSLNPDKAQIKGSRVQKEIENFLNTNNDLLEEGNIVSREVDIKTDMGDEGAIGRTRFLNNLNGVKKRLSEASESYILKNAGLISSSILLNEFFDSGASYKIDALIDSLRGDAQNFILTIQLRKQLENRAKTEPGKAAPDFSIRTTDGNMLSLDSLKGKNVLLSFTASWCNFCNVETKALIKYFDQHKKAPLDIISISLDANESDWLAHIDENKIAWKHHVTDTVGIASSLLQSYNVREVPYTVAIDTAGVIIGRGNSCDEFKDIFTKTDSTSVK